MGTYYAYCDKVRLATYASVKVKRLSFSIAQSSTCSLSLTQRRLYVTLYTFFVTPINGPRVVEWCDAMVSGVV